MTTDITELAQREKFETWFKSSFHPDKTGPYIKDQLYFAWKAASAELVEALEKAQTKAIEQGRTACELFDEVTALRQRIAELESRTVTDWIEHDGKWRPDSLSTDELVYLKTRKQELKIPYPAGKVMGWMHTGGDMDVMAYKLASPQARTVTVKLPELCVGVVQDGHAVMVPYPAGHWFNKTAILEMLAAAGIKVEAE
ncbi:TPA: hypothetical protein MAQ12_005011 [Klebsiella pneumoniae]|uniref:hypothetical protein n=1 Tax=Bacteria TaxID=2 RepID=UPI000DA781B4|nr:MULTISPECIES: hypothetical protein [Bacteria]MRJ50636.1 hypothetical protein [Klebsiella pneumoniae]PZE00990.1 hypothetical protein DND31_12630 [Klebsiella pneumoniae]PZE06705.1 hypothetical protein DND32_12305 [Klebsiella pneumoniae]WKI11638.1 hypothetical protein QYQ42_14450 [Klebsiella pneumoniae]WKI15392.1 hypothetical protein QYQ42_09045 [Klebsiella pneumoniae]